MKNLYRENKVKIYTKKFIVPLALIIILLSTSACKPHAKLIISELYGTAIKIIGEEKTNFSAYASIFNETTGIEVGIENWSFTVYAGDEKLFEVNKSNYKNLPYNVAVSTPVPGYYTNGLIIITIGIPAYKAYVVDLDLFNGKIPDKLDFYCSVKDIHGNISELNQTSTITFQEMEPSSN